LFAHVCADRDVRTLVSPVTLRVSRDLEGASQETRPRVVRGFPDWSYK